MVPGRQGLLYPVLPKGQVRVVKATQLQPNCGQNMYVLQLLRNKCKDEQPRGRVNVGDELVLPYG